MSSYAPVLDRASMGWLDGLEPGRSQPELGPAIDRQRCELLATLTLQIVRGGPAEARVRIDRLLAQGADFDHGLAGDLRTLRAVATLEHARLPTPGSNAGTAWLAEPGESALRVMLAFGERILPALHQLMRAHPDSQLAYEMERELFGRAPGRRASTTEPHGALSDREFQVIQLVAVGKSNRDIGDALCISEGTVKRHVSNVFDKLQAENRTQAVAHAR